MDNANLDEADLIPAAELAARNATRIAGESAEYRAARTALLTEEIALRRQIERFARLRRALPPGAVIDAAYRFAGEHGDRDFPGLFGRHDTLLVYNDMYGP